VASLIDRSLRAMLPGIKSQLSSINSVYELKDFASLRGTIAKLNNVFGRTKLASRLSAAKRRSVFPNASYYRRLRDTFSGKYGPTLREHLDASTDAYLQASFNILPLLSDIAGISRVISETLNRINDLVNRRGSLQRRHFTAALSDPSLITAPTNTNFGIVDNSTYTNGYTPVYGGHLLGMTLTRVPELISASFHAEIEYNYNFTQYEVENAQLLGFLDAMGVNLDPAIIWNAIPYSFMIDWLVGVNQWLSDRKRLLLNPKINIVRYLWSWNCTRIVRSSFKSYQHAAYSPDVTDTRLPVVTESAYRRTVSMPDSSSIASSGLSFKEFTLGAALVISRKSSRKPRLAMPKSTK